ncbi:signal recognition particle-docking protein FtsY [Halochromatium glycolicum]|uniref:Signal recognition particle receptor FtsY n=1 Tax=Halochromatium glycolicum TaxID=85075 RepID=A0AAJ0U879_9GAMM|nr:signal recognition particle-docking protein FtsY [Halochromatium glycolicum]MBK1707124.1 signal recognition particle-docking protein FtsY [Halochromatium glycolicum]
MFGFGKKKRRDQAEEAAVETLEPEAHKEPGPQPKPPGRESSVPTQGPNEGAAQGAAPTPVRPQPADTPADGGADEVDDPYDLLPGQGRLGDAIARAAARREEEAAQKRRLFAGLKSGLARTRAVLNADIGDLVSGRTEIDEDLLEELEMLLLAADVGVPATRRIIDDLAYRVKRREALEPDTFLSALRRELAALLVSSQSPVKQAAPGRPQVVLMVGVNGAGKTTTIGKLARQLQDEGNSVMLAAGDTFRAAAVEQLQEWGARNQVPVIAQHTGADPASVIYDALQAATSRGTDVLIADTAGRLHTKSNLMEELKKIARVLKKLDPDAPHEVMLVVDASAGQNALQQAIQFNEALPLTGITLTKLDGTAKGGIIFAIAERLDVPFRFIGVGEKVEDLRHFDPETFLDALLSP